MQLGIGRRSRHASPGRRACSRASSSVSRCSTQRSSSGIAAGSTTISCSGRTPPGCRAASACVLRRRRYSSACCFRISGPMRRSSETSEFTTREPAGCRRRACRSRVLRRRDVCRATCSSCGRFSSSTKPWVSTALNGARPARADRPPAGCSWNQPRCWSLPSRYRSAGQGPPRSSSAKPCVLSRFRTRRRRCPSPGRKSAASRSWTQEAGRRRRADTRRRRPRSAKVGGDAGPSPPGRARGSLVRRSTKTGDRDAPGALAADAPVRAAGDHRVAMRLRPASGIEVRGGDRTRAHGRGCARGHRCRMNHCGVAR